jgi:hypothetical protein
MDMLITNKIIEIFCIASDFYKEKEHSNPI